MELEHKYFYFYYVSFEKSIFFEQLFLDMVTFLASFCW